MEEITPKERAERRTPKFTLELTEDNKLKVTRWCMRAECDVTSLAEGEQDSSLLKRMRYKSIVCDLFGPTTLGFVKDGVRYFIPTRFTGSHSEYGMWTREIQFTEPITQTNE
jgi:hypothetical protein